MVGEPTRKLAVILHADVVGSTALVQANETLSHQRIRDTFRRLSEAITAQDGIAHEIRGDALVAEFSRASDAVEAALQFQADNTAHIDGLPDDIRLAVRVGIALGEVIVADGTVTGEAVVLAQRLEQLAEPGGVCVQGTAQDTVPKRLPYAYESLDERELKGFPEPVRVFVVKRANDVSDAQPIVVRPVEPAALELPDKPSIAVLPFTNMSGDPEQEYFSDGITEDIITELSRFRELFVIARNSSFAFKDVNVDVRDVGTKLGVRYVLEGSVRRAGDRIRVTAQLLEAADGGHLWADRYDRDLEDIFEVQDDVVRSIAAVLPGRIAEAAAELGRRNPTMSLSAYDWLIRGNHVLRRRGENIKEAIESYRKAIELDPECAAAYAGIAVAEGNSVWDLSYYHDNPLDRAYEAGKRAIELDSSDYRSHAAFGEALRQLGQHALSRQHLERALTLNPNSARVLGCWAMLLAYTGEPERAIDTYHQAARLDPLGADNLRPEVLSEAYYNMREYEKALTVLESMLKLPIFYVHQQMAMCYAQLGDKAACEASMARYRAGLPESYDERLLYESHIRLCALQEDRDHWIEGYRLTGMDV